MIILSFIIIFLLIKIAFFPTKLSFDKEVKEIIKTELQINYMRFFEDDNSPMADHKENLKKNIKKLIGVE